jgi:hypothetical protein
VPTAWTSVLVERCGRAQVPFEIVAGLDRRDADFKLLQ